MMGKIETTAFDSADYLNSAEAIAAYLDAWLQEGTPEELRNALDTVARSKGISDLAARSGITRQGIYKALGQDEERSHAGGMASTAVTSFETIRSILSAMGLRLTVEPAEVGRKWCRSHPLRTGPGQRRI